MQPYQLVPIHPLFLIDQILMGDLDICPEHENSLGSLPC
jgi:hypothetical protein